MSLTSSQVEDARIRVQTTTAGAEGDPEILCTSLAHVIPLLEALRPALEKAASEAHWLPGWIVGGLVSTVAELLLTGLRRWREAKCGATEPEPPNLEG